MQNNLFVSAPNLIGDIYRHNTIQSTGKFHNSYDFIDINQDGVFLLGTSDMSGRVWSGTVWTFSDISDVPDVEKCSGSLDFDCGVSSGKWLNDTSNMAVGTDSGSVNILTLTSMINADKQYLSLKCVLCEHEDGVTSLDVSSDNTKVVSGSRDMSIKILNVENVTTEKTYSYAHSQTVNCVSFKPGKSHIFISTSSDGNSLLWDTRQEKPASLIMNTDSGFTACTWIDDNCAALGGNNGEIFFMDVRKKEELEEKVCSNRPIHYFSYERSSQLLAACADDPLIRVYNCAEATFPRIYISEKHEDFVRGLCWKPPNRLYSCGFGKALFSEDIPYEVKDLATNAAMEENNAENTANE